MDPDAIDRGPEVCRRARTGELGLDHGHAAHSMRATFITTALENGAQLEDVQKVPVIVTRAPLTYMIGADTTRRKRPASFATY
jgi:hypothetical protein